MEVLKDILTLEHYTSKDFREIDEILNNNKQAALNLAQRQKEYRGLENEISKTLKPVGKDKSAKKFIYEAIFFLLIGFWFGCVSYFNPKLIG